MRHDGAGELRSTFTAAAQRRQRCAGCHASGRGGVATVVWIVKDERRRGPDGALDEAVMRELGAHPVGVWRRRR